MHIGAARHAFLLFLPMKKPCHLERVSLIEEESTHDPLKREYNNCDKTLYTINKDVVNGFLLDIIEEPPFL